MGETEGKRLHQVSSDSEPDGDISIQRVEKAIGELKRGHMVVMSDDEDRENEGDLVCAAQFATPETIAFMASQGRGLICLTMPQHMADRVGVRPMVAENRAPLGTAFTVSIEASSGVTTGISAADRAHTIQVATKPDASPSDIVSPGHVFPIVARAGGVLVRAGQTEGSVDLCRLAGLRPSGVI